MKKPIQQATNGTELPGSYSLSLYRGDSYKWKFQLWSDPEKTKPLILEDVTPKAEIRDAPSGSEIVPLQCVIELPNIVLMELLADDSKNLSKTTIVWDMQFTYIDGQVKTILAGNVVATLDVTDSSEVLQRQPPMHRQRQLLDGGKLR